MLVSGPRLLAAPGDCLRLDERDLVPRQAVDLIYQGVELRFCSGRDPARQSAVRQNAGATELTAKARRTRRREELTAKARRTPRLVRSL
jgi:hypothetical protein